MTGSSDNRWQCVLTLAQMANPSFANDEDPESCLNTLDYKL